MRLTVHNTGCGLGDMLNRIDVVYKLCLRFDHQFIFPDVVSSLHGQDYAKALGLDAITPNVRGWDGEVVRMPLSALMRDDCFAGIDSSGQALVEIQFEHAISEDVINKFQLRKLVGFDYREYISKVFSLGEKKFDYIIHLRLGDNYAYSLANGNVLDSGRRRIVGDPRIVSEIMAAQWSIEDVLKTCSILRDRGAEYCVHCDGIESVVKHIRWHKDPSYDESRALLLPAVEGFFKEFIMRCDGLSNFYVGNEDIKLAIQSLLSSRNLIYSGGGFMRVINRLWNSPPVPSENIKSFLAGQCCSAS